LDFELNRRQLKTDTYFDLVEADIVEEEKVLLEQKIVYEKTKENYDSLLDKYNVYKKAKQLSSNITFEIIDRSNNFEEIEVEGTDIESNLKNICGIIKGEDEIKLKKMVFRTSRG
jgi:hypothetical protein